MRFERKLPTQAISLEHVQHFADVIFEFFVMLDEIASPFRRIPDLKFVIHSNQNYFEVIFNGNGFAEFAGNKDTTGFIDI